MPPKRTAKLRNSCDACTIAKVGCTKEKPVCSRCARRNTLCSYTAVRRGGRSTLSASATERGGSLTTASLTSPSTPIRSSAPPSPNDVSPHPDMLACLDSINGGHAILAHPSPACLDLFATPDPTPATDSQLPFEFSDFLESVPQLQNDFVLDGGSALGTTPPAFLSASSQSASLHDNPAYAHQTDKGTPQSSITGAKASVDPTPSSSLAILPSSTSATSSLDLASSHEGSNESSISLRSAIDLDLDLGSSGGDGRGGSVSGSGGGSGSCSGGGSGSCSGASTTLTSASTSLTDDSTTLTDVCQPCQCFSQAHSLLNGLSQIYRDEGPDSEDSNSGPDLNLSFSRGSRAQNLALRRNEEAIKLVDHILQCQCSRNAYLLVVLSLIVHAMLQWYGAAAHARPDLDEHEVEAEEYGKVIGEFDDHSTISLRASDAESDQRFMRQLVLSKLHRVQRVVNILSPRLRAFFEHDQGREGQVRRVDGGGGGGGCGGSGGMEPSEDMARKSVAAMRLNAPFSTAFYRELDGGLRESQRLLPRTIIERLRK